MLVMVLLVIGLAALAYFMVNLVRSFEKPEPKRPASVVHEKDADKAKEKDKEKDKEKEREKDQPEFNPPPP
jgi:Na+-transporting methylmalonyl-CoA/oxaloacetate decarboxylase gamma subunit